MSLAASFTTYFGWTDSESQPLDHASRVFPLEPRGVRIHDPRARHEREATEGAETVRSTGGKGVQHAALRSPQHDLVVASRAGKR